MAPNFDQISKLRMNREAIRLKVKVTRMWTLPMYTNPSQTASVEMILLDQFGCKIQASIKKPLLYKFTPVVEEGAIYKMLYFSVIPNTGNYRGTHHDFKLNFLFKTTVVKIDDDSIPDFGFTFVPFNEIERFGENHEFLIDVIGVLTGVFPEKQYAKDGKMTTMVVMELTDSTGKIEVALFGDYVDQLRSFFLQGVNVQVIVIIQLAHVKNFRGKNVLQNSMTATKLLLNPDLPEALSFRMTIAEHGVIDAEPLSVILDNSKEGLENEFMKLHPRKSVSQIQDMKEGSMFVVLTTILEIAIDGDWYYMACKCNHSISLKSKVYYCDTCEMPVFQVSPRFKLKVEVIDDSSTSVFVLFDRDVSVLLNKTCEELLKLSFQVPTERGFPDLVGSLIGRRMLFKVDTMLNKSMQFEGTFPVRRICDDEAIIAMFDLAGGDCTPTKALFTPSFSNVDTSLDIEETFPGINSSTHYSPLSLGDDDTSIIPKYTPAKRCLEVDFLSCQFGEAAKKGKAIDVVEIEDEGQSSFELVPVKIEKD